MNAHLLQHIRYRILPSHLFGEVLSKPWVDNAIPALLLVFCLCVFGLLIPDFLNLSSASSMSRLAGELSFVVLGMTLVILAGGVDLSVGSVFALTNFAALYFLNYLHWPVAVAVPAVLAVGALCGLLNGVLIGYFKLRAFLTTLATLIIVRAMVDLLTFGYGGDLVAGFPQSKTWDLLADGSLFGIPLCFVVAIVVACMMHLFLTRMRLGWRITAVGGSRRSSFNAGIDVRLTVCLTYVMASVFAAFAGLLYAARLNSAGSATGVGLELTALTAAVLGGNSLGGGRGSVAKALLGTFIVVILTSAFLRLQMPSGYNSLVLGAALLLAVAADVRWLKNRHKLLSSVYVSPTFFAPPPAPAATKGSGTVYEVNDRLSHAEAIGLDQVDGAEDIAFDEHDNLYTGSRHGQVLRFMAPDYQRREVYAHIGGQPLGLHFDGEGQLHACVSGMGLYKVTKDRASVLLSDQTNRSWTSIIDDSRMRFADDMDFAPDGSVFFSEATIRYDVNEWATDCLEARGNGRLLRYDKKTGITQTVLRNRIFPNGVCMTGDGQSLLFAETWASRICRYWFAGPKQGKVETVVESLPGYPDNIRRASDGNYWVAMLGMRTPTMDLAMTMPSFRRRMAKRVAFEEWLYPNINAGGVVRFALDGTIVESLWDSSSTSHPTVTSMREHKGYLYLGGIFNNRIGRIRLPGADPDFNDRHLYFGKPK